MNAVGLERGEGKRREGEGRMGGWMGGRGEATLAVETAQSRMDGCD